MAKADTTFKQAFQLADEVLQQGVRSITDLMVMPGLINLDFADVKSVMEEMGKAMMGTGEGEGENRALEAAERAIANPLLDGVSMAGAKGVIISIIGGEDMKLLEVDEAANHIRELVDENANIIWGSAFNPDLDGKIRVSVVATGIEGSEGMSAGSSQSMSLGSGRAPRRPVLDLPSEDEEEMQSEAPAEEPAIPAGVAALGLSAASAGSYSDEDDEEYDEDGDVDGIVDPLAGLRQDDDEDARACRSRSDDQFRERRAMTASSQKPRTSRSILVMPSNWDDVGGAKSGVSDDEPLDLGGAEAAADEGNEHAPAGGTDDLLRNADKLAEQDAPVRGGRRRQLIAGGEGAEAKAGQVTPAPAAPAAPAKEEAGGSTLFERMANLSRGSASKDDDDDDDDDDNGGSLSIPRFLGRQNNQ